MEQQIARMQKHLAEVPDMFRDRGEEETARRPAPGKWSAKEILGHLCDSAINNLARFVRAQTEQPYALIPYQQDEWVKAQAYQARPADEIVQLWSSLNRSVVAVMSAMPPAACEHACILADGTTVSLRWLMEDYVAHMEHHLGQLSRQLGQG
ncbi:DinB family protein [Brevibacillus agri]|uniref:DinB family protein n=1 Tax=Brevibacillus agri TaxID=51101 RepID=UPI0024BF6EBB|nr:DinB family protein [Brevibacillus agri]WHX32136.1 DinB family protein [Brevibacillus agri]